MRRYYLTQQASGGWLLSVWRGADHERSWSFRYRWMAQPAIWRLRLSGVRPG